MLFINFVAQDIAQSILVKLNEINVNDWKNMLPKTVVQFSTISLIMRVTNI